MAFLSLAVVFFLYFNRHSARADFFPLFRLCGARYLQPHFINTILASHLAILHKLRQAPFYELVVLLFFFVDFE